MGYPMNVTPYVPTEEDLAFIRRAEVWPIPLEEIAKRYLDRWMNQCYIENDKDGFTGYRWDKFGKALAIASAANRYGGIVIMGPRHYSNNMHTAIDALGGRDRLMDYCGDDYEQGFVDQYSTFHSRKDAWVIAEAAGQIRFRDGLPKNELYSEHLI